MRRASTPQAPTSLIRWPHRLPGADMPTIVAPDGDGEGDGAGDGDGDGDGDGAGDGAGDGDGDGDGDGAGDGDGDGFGWPGQYGPGHQRGLGW